MFTQLVESNPPAPRSRGGAVFSFVAHYGLILLVIYTSAEAASTSTGPVAEKVRFVEPPPVKSLEKVESPPELLAAPVVPKAAALLLAPLHVPDALPEIDLSRPPTDPGLFSGKRQPGTTPERGSSVEREPARPDGAYLEHEVEKPVVPAPNSATPAYPDILRQAGVEGQALVSFVVDTLGRVDVATFKVIHTTHELFASAVRTALPRLRFIPAETVRGRVRQHVQQPFSFAIVR